MNECDCFSLSLKMELSKTYPGVLLLSYEYSEYGNTVTELSILSIYHLFILLREISVV